MQRTSCFSCFSGYVQRVSQEMCAVYSVFLAFLAFPLFLVQCISCFSCFSFPVFLVFPLFLGRCVQCIACFPCFLGNLCKSVCFPHFFCVFSTPKCSNDSDQALIRTAGLYMPCLHLVTFFFVFYSCMYIYVRYSLGQGGLTTGGLILNIPQTNSSYCLYERRCNLTRANGELPFVQRLSLARTSSDDAILPFRTLPG